MQKVCQTDRQKETGKHQLGSIHEVPWSYSQFKPYKTCMEMREHFSLKGLHQQILTSHSELKKSARICYTWNKTLGGDLQTRFTPQTWYNIPSKTLKYQYWTTLDDTVQVLHNNQHNYDNNSMTKPLYFHYKMRTSLYKPVRYSINRLRKTEHRWIWETEHRRRLKQKLQSGTDNTLTMFKWAWLMQFDSSLRQTQEKELF